MRTAARGPRAVVSWVLTCGMLAGAIGCGTDGTPAEAAELRVHGLAQGLYIDLLFVDVEPEGEDDGEDEPRPEPAEPGDDDLPMPDDPDDEQQTPTRPDPDGEPGGGPPIVRGTTPGAAPQQAAGALARFGPEPEVRLTGEREERVTDRLAHVAVAVPALAPPGVEQMEVEVEGDRTADGGAQARAVATGASLGGLVVGHAEASCEATVDDVAATATLQGVEVLGDPVDTAALAPNTQMTEVELPGLADDVTITFNRQETVVRGGVATLQVTAVHVHTEEGGNSRTDGEMWLARAACGVR